uniref:Cytochrome P450 2J1-like n=1 Tax=Pogona vitticeps TaxID=103695 RepID=A0ABM5FVE6_9SAUR
MGSLTCGEGEWETVAGTTVEDSITELDFVSSLYEISPLLMKCLPGPHKKALFRIQQSKSMLMKVVEKYKQCQLQHEPEDFIEYYLLQMEKSKGNAGSTYDEENLVQCIFDLITAGVETSTNSLQWGLLFMAHHPDIQENVYKELEDILGSSPSICYQDCKKLPYTQAVIHEILRIRYILPLGVPRRSTKEVNICGYNIPKGTFFMANMPALFLDPKRWKTPKEFNPSHFLDEDGNFVLREDFVPFGAGARVCLGEQLGKMELFLFLTYLLRAFHFQPTRGVEELNKEPVLGFTLHPEPYQIRAIPRISSS